jgi:hypothetical protein
MSEANDHPEEGKGVLYALAAYGFWGLHAALLAAPE